MSLKFLNSEVNMNRRSFIASSAVLSAGSMLTGCMGNKINYKNEALHNWAGNINYTSHKVYHPGSVEEVQQIVKSNNKLKCLGSKHSFSTIADTDGFFVATDNLKSVLKLDEKNKSVIIEPGIAYGDLSVYLQQRGYALHNLASLPHISVAGACATATHGSGVKNGNLSSAVNAVEFIDGSGNLQSLSRSHDRDIFNGVVVHLGALGVVTKLSLDILPTFNMSQVVYRHLPIENLKQSFSDIMSAGYSVSLFTNWTEDKINQVWIKSVQNASGATASSPDFYGASLSQVDMHPVDTQSAETCTFQRGVVAPWFEILPHFKMGFKPSTGKELQSEFFVSKDAGFAAVEAMQALGKQISSHLFVSEIRSVKADELWMSPAYQKDCITIHTTWHQDDKVITELIPLVQKALQPFDPVPHWAKLSSLPPATLRKAYPRMNDFRELCKRFDPQKKFANKYLDEFVFG
jgi:xylitol oxidase